MSSETNSDVKASSHDAQRWALVDESGTVTNVVLWDGNRQTWAPPDDLTPHLVDDAEELHPVGIGWRLVHGHWVDPG